MTLLNLFLHILTPFKNLSNFKLKNSYQVRQELEDITLVNDKVLVSFDVKSLFPSFPSAWPSNASMFYSSRQKLYFRFIRNLHGSKCSKFDYF